MFRGEQWVLGRVHLEKMDEFWVFPKKIKVDFRDLMILKFRFLSSKKSFSGKYPAFGLFFFWVLRVWAGQPQKTLLSKLCMYLRIIQDLFDSKWLVCEDTDLLPEASHSHKTFEQLVSFPSVAGLWNLRDPPWQAPGELRNWRLFRQREAWSQIRLQVLAFRVAKHN